METLCKDFQDISIKNKPNFPREIVDEICLFLPIEKTIHLSSYSSLRIIKRNQDSFLNEILVKTNVTDVYFFYKKYFHCEYTLYHITQCIFNNHYIIFYDILKNKEYTLLENLNILQYIIFSYKKKFFQLLIGVKGEEHILNTINAYYHIYELIARKDCIFLIEFIAINKDKIPNYESAINTIFNEAVMYSSFKIIKFCFENELKNCNLKEDSLVYFIVRRTNCRVFKYIIEKFNPEITWKIKRKCAMYGTLKMNKLIKNNL